MIVENKLSSLNNNVIKVNKKPVPQSVNKELPPLFFTGIWVGSKGTGKSYNLVKLLKNYEQFPIYDISKNKLNIRIILFCPTYHSSANEIFKTLKDLDEADVILNYSDDSLLEILHEIQEEKEEIELYAKYCKAYKQFEKENDLNTLNADDMLLLYKYNFEHPDDLPNKPKYNFPRINFLIFDDLIGNNQAFKRGNSAINNLVIKHRHLQCNLIFTTQYPKAIPPIIRNNMDIWVLFKSASKERVLDQVYPEISSLITEENFEEIYEHATQDNHDSLIIINHNLADKNKSFRKNWDIALNIT